MITSFKDKNSNKPVSEIYEQLFLEISLKEIQHMLRCIKSWYEDEGFLRPVFVSILPKHYNERAINCDMDSSVFYYETHKIDFNKIHSLSEAFEILNYLEEFIKSISRIRHKNQFEYLLKNLVTESARIINMPDPGELKVGHAVNWKGIENGKISYIKNDNYYVVFECGGDWENYMNYPYEICDRNTLSPGWI